MPTVRQAIAEKLITKYNFFAPMVVLCTVAARAVIGALNNNGCMNQDTPNSAMPIPNSDVPSIFVCIPSTRDTAPMPTPKISQMIRVRKCEGRFFMVRKE